MKSNVGIFRALDVRFIHAEFAASFEAFRPIFAANIPAEMRAYLEKEKVAHYDLPLKPSFVFDPVYPLLHKTDFTPWLHFDPERLQAIAAGLQVFEIYEPYFFYSSQIADLAQKNHVPLVTEIWTSFPEHPSHYLPP